jgi:hypothetical protein
VVTPNPFRVARSVLGTLIRVSSPAAVGTTGVELSDYAQVLAAVAARPGGAAGMGADLRRAVEAMAAVEPDRLSRSGALAFWIDLYNAGALELAARAAAEGQETVLRLPGAFDRPFVTVAGEVLSLDAVEHAKVRRFGDPRIHAALVCGSVSCPTLRPAPFSGADLQAALDDQMRRFLARGGAVLDRSSGEVSLSRVFSWYGADFVRPGRMPTFVPARRTAVLAALEPWLGTDDVAWIRRARPRVVFQPYDWGLRCSVG